MIILPLWVSTNFKLKKRTWFLFSKGDRIDKLLRVKIDIIIGGRLRIVYNCDLFGDKIAILGIAETNIATTTLYWHKL